MKFNFFEDPGHGWLEVPIEYIELTGLRNKISAYSYRKGDMVYLEEDCDASLFSQVMKGLGHDFVINRIYQEVTPIRGYNRFTA